MAKVIIKKYPSRRLYNTQISSYVSLNDLFSLVKEGVDFQVIDSKDGSDVTKTILTQIIFDQETKGYNLLPVSLLRQIIRYYDTQQGTLFIKYLETIINNYEAQQAKFKGFSSGNPLKMFETLNKSNIEIFESSFKALYDSFKPGGNHNE